MIGGLFIAPQKQRIERQEKLSSSGVIHTKYTGTTDAARNTPEYASATGAERTRRARNV